MKPTNSNSKNSRAVSKATLAHRIDALVEGQSANLPGLGVVKCIKSARAAKDHKRRFSVTKSTVAKNRSGYTFTALVEAFGLRG